MALAWVLAALAAGFALAQDPSADEEAAPEKDRLEELARPGAAVKGFSVPDFDATGALRGRLTGITAVMVDDHTLKVQGIRYQQMTNGRVLVGIEVPECLFDQRTQTVTTHEFVKVERQGVSISGRGFFWSVPHQRGSIQSNVVMVIHDIEKGLVKRDK